MKIIKKITLITLLINITNSNYSMENNAQLQERISDITKAQNALNQTINLMINKTLENPFRNKKA